MMGQETYVLQSLWAIVPQSFHSTWAGRAPTQGEITVINPKRLLATIVGIASILLGGGLRLVARDLAWPKNWEFSGPLEYSEWAIRQRAYEHLSILIFAFGLVLRQA